MGTNKMIYREIVFLKMSQQDHAKAREKFCRLIKRAAGDAGPTPGPKTTTRYVVGTVAAEAKCLILMAHAEIAHLDCLLTIGAKIA